MYQCCEFRLELKCIHYIFWCCFFIAMPNPLPILGNLSSAKQSLSKSQNSDAVSTITLFKSDVFIIIIIDKNNTTVLWSKFSVSSSNVCWLVLLCHYCKKIEFGRYLCLRYQFILISYCFVIRRKMYDWYDW